jgi:hypothetical protein
MPGLLIIHINFLAGVFDKTLANLYFLEKTSPPLVD